MSSGELEKKMMKMDGREISTLSNISKWSSLLEAGLYVDRNEAGISEL